MKAIDEDFWKTEGINNYRFQGAPTYYEGEHNVYALKSFVGANTVRDVCCGYGRLATLFDPKKYTGYDICEAAIQKATRLFPDHSFVHWTTPMASADTTLFVNSGIVIDDGGIEDIVVKLCADTNHVIVAEVMEPKDCPHRESTPEWHGRYTRTIEAYDELFAKVQFKRNRCRYSLHEMVKVPYTIAKWSRVDL